MPDVPDVEPTLQKLHQVKTQLSELREDASTRRFTGSSEDGSVHALVDGTGRLHELTIPNEEIRSSHPARLGPKVMAALADARQKANNDTNTRIAELLPSFGD